MQDIHTNKISRFLTGYEKQLWHCIWGYVGKGPNCTHQSVVLRADFKVSDRPHGVICVERTVRDARQNGVVPLGVSVLVQTRLKPLDTCEHETQQNLHEKKVIPDEFKFVEMIFLTLYFILILQRNFFLDIQSALWQICARIIEFYVKMITRYFVTIKEILRKLRRKNLKLYTLFSNTEKCYFRNRHLRRMTIETV